MKRKILLLSDDFPPYVRGGAGIVAGSDAFELAKRNFEVTVITTVQDKTLAGSFDEGNVHIERLYVPKYHPRWRAWISLYNRSSVRVIKKLVKDFAPEIVHAHNIHEYISYKVLSVAKKTGARVFLTAHDAMLVHYGKIDRPRHITAIEQLHEFRFWYNPFRNFYIRHILKNVEKIFTVSNALKKVLEINGVSNIEVLYNGINPHMWKSKISDVESFEEKHFLKGKDVVLFSGRISSAKGGDVLCAALPLIIKHAPNMLLVIAGTETEYVQTLKAQAVSLGLSKYIHCTGWLSSREMCDAYHSSKIVVVPSQYLDPLPTTVLEGMACGKPVIGSAAGGILEMILSHVTGELIEPKDIDGFAKATIKLLLDTELQREYGDRGYERITQIFSIEKKMQVYEAYYREKVSGTL